VSNIHTPRSLRVTGGKFNPGFYNCKLKIIQIQTCGLPAASCFFSSKHLATIRASRKFAAVYQVNF
jgi:hypothetical protein